MSFLRPDLDETPAYSRPSEPAGLVRLHMNEAADDWPSAAKEALLARLRDLPFQQYPERQAELAERLRLRLGAPEGGLLLGPSSGNLLDHVALAGLRPGDTVAIPSPGFSLYPMLVRRHQGQVRPLDMGTGFPLEPWFTALDCRQLWITLPNNPTGAWLSPDDLEPLLEAAAARPEPPLVVLDEAYAEFAPQTHRLAVDRYPNLLLLRTFSKALASASWRLGYLMGDPSLVRRLAALQLPYSIPAASLEALDVALDFAAEFESRIFSTADLRDRLRASLPDREVAPSAANFLHISPDPAPALQEAGLLARALPGSNAARVGIGTEEVVRRTAAALKATLAAASPRTRRALLVLDVDGVLIEADRSFMEAVSRALAELVPGLSWTDEHFRAFKRVGGFNNDFRLCSAAWVLAEHGAMERLWTAGGVGFPEFESEIQRREPPAQRVVQQHYAETCKLEKPLIELEALRSLGCDLAILTGRPPEELAMAFDVLGWRLPALADAAPHLRKPSPSGLLQLADAFRAEAITFVGDTRDDAACLRSARELRPDLRWRFAAVGADRDLFRDPQDLSAPTLLDLLPLLQERP
ncbi:MAG: aminotransferase class I/II-fold pyridoxal phosphate-dependent enzyme [Holophagaceae bacterium]|nr:aminotransferase class I/II-fold pyridoxal phosphate-dependent enzyme [Holophagaceae bacterium]